MKTLPVNARWIRWSGLPLLVTAIIARPALGQNQELTFSLGGIPSQTRSFQASAGIAQISADRSLGINYGHRFLDARIAALYGEIEFVAVPTENPFRGFHQCNIVTSRSKLATISIRQGQAYFAIWLKFTGLIPWRIAHSRCNHGNRPNILLRLVHSHQPQSFLLIPFQPSKKRGPVPPDGVVFAAWPVRLLPRSVRLTK
jgi:hypothetical protein